MCRGGGGGATTPSNPKHTTKNHRARLQAPTGITGVFSKHGRGEPVGLFRSLLMLAGDVERNPGPACSACMAAIKKNTVPLVCVCGGGGGECGAYNHASFSGLSRAGRRETAGAYRCRRCRGDKETPPSRSPEDGGEETEVWVCDLAIRRRAAHAECGCGFKAHKKCTGRRRGDEGEWRCPTCGGVEQRSGSEGEGRSAVVEMGEAGPAQHQPPISEEPLGNCGECGSRLKRVILPLVCRGCRGGFHLKCAQGQRKVIEMERESGTWMCKQCRERRSKTPEREPSATTSQGATTHRGSIKLLQWNCDWLGTKTDELPGVLREEEIDMAALQETKLREGDPTPRIEGYMILRSDRRTERRDNGARGVDLAFAVRRGINCWTDRVDSNSHLEGFILNIPEGAKAAETRRR